MTIVKYKSGFNKIEKVSIVRETGGSVFVLNGYGQECRSPKLGYFNTWNDAHEFLTAKATKNVNEARRHLELANATLGNIKGLKPPKDAP